MPPLLPAWSIFLSRALAEGKTVVITILAFAVVFGVLALAHEFGHFLLAKMLGMTVEQFGIGFPPTYGWTLFRRSGTSYTLHPVPLGAFVKIQGMDPGDQDSPNSFLRQPPWARLIVLAAGSAANLVLAVVVFIAMGVVTGLPQKPYMSNLVEDVGKGTPAERAGLRPGDAVIAVRRANQRGEWVRPDESHTPADADRLVSLIHHSFRTERRAGKSVDVGMPLTVNIRRKDGSLISFTATPLVRSDRGEKMAALGYVPEVATEYKKVGPIEAVAGGFDETVQNVYEMVDFLQQKVLQLFRRQISAQEFGDNFGGPVMIARVSGHFAEAGLAQFLKFLGMLSINLAILNLLPLPVFDGGNILLVGIEVIRRKQLDPGQFMVVQALGVALILSLFVVLTIKDVLRISTGVGMP